MNPIKVSDLKLVNPTKYTEGQIFFSNKQIGIIQGGKMERLVKESELKNYPTKTQVENMIQKATKGSDTK